MNDTINQRIISDDSLEELRSKIDNYIDPTTAMIITKDDYFFIKGYGSNTLTIEELKEKTNIIDFVEICKENDIDYRNYLREEL